VRRKIAVYVVSDSGMVIVERFGIRRPPHTPKE